MIAVYPISHKTALNISLYTLDAAAAASRLPYPGKSVASVKGEEVHEVFGDVWEPEVIRILEARVSFLSYSVDLC
jgi:hypothetical protein